MNNSLQPKGIESKLGRNNKAIGQFSHDIEWKEEKRRRINEEFPIKIKNCWHVTQSTFHYRFVFCFRHRLGLSGLNVPRDQQSSWFIHLSSQFKSDTGDDELGIILWKRGRKIVLSKMIIKMMMTKKIFFNSPWPVLMPCHVCQVHLGSPGQRITIDYHVKWRRLSLFEFHYQCVIKRKLEIKLHSLFVVAALSVRSWNGFRK